MRLDTIQPTTIRPMPAPAQHTLAAAWALGRAQRLLNPIGIPEQPPPPDITGARDAIREAVDHFQQALDLTQGQPGHVEAQAALDQARQALAYLNRPGINPPIATVTEHAFRGAELAREALTRFHTIDAWPLPAA